MRELKKTTSVNVTMGPAVNYSDAVAEYSSTFSVGIMKGVTEGARGGGAAAHNLLGYFSVPLNSVDTNTVGPIRLYSHSAAAYLPVWEDFAVITSAAWNVKYGTTPGATSAGVIAGLAALNDPTIASVSAAVATALGNYDAATKTENDAAIESARADLATDIAALPTAAGIADSVWDESQAAHVAAPSFGAQMSAAVAGAGATPAQIWHYSVSAAMVSGQAGYVLQSAAENAGTTVSGAVSSADISNIANHVWDEALALHTAAGSVGQRLSRVPSGPPGANGGCPTVDNNNHIAGIQGSVNALQSVAVVIWDASQASHVGGNTMGGQMSAAALGGGVSIQSVSAACAQAIDDNAEAACDAALVARRLDELLGNVMSAPVADSAFDSLMGTGFIKAEDSLFQIRDDVSGKIAGLNDVTIASVSAAAAQALADYPVATSGAVAGVTIASVSAACAQALGDYPVASSGLAGGATAAQVWHYSVSAAMVSGQAGYVMQSAAANAGAVVSGAVSSADVSNIAVSTWDALRSAHIASGSMGEALSLFYGSGNVPVNEDTGGANNLRATDTGGAGIDEVQIRVYTKTNYDSKLITLDYIQAQSITDANGDFKHPVYLDSGVTYTFVYTKPGSYDTQTKEITI